MKIKGVQISGPNIETIIIPRGDGEPIVFQAKAVLDMKLFDTLCPEPKPPMRLMKGGIRVPDVENEAFRNLLQTHSEQRYNYIIIASLQATEDLVWDTVDINKPSTWKNYEKELQDSGFSRVEIQRIIMGAMNANCLNEAKIEEARNRFLAGQQEQQNHSSSQVDEQKITPSGVPAKGS